MLDCDAPVVAQIDGNCMGAGLEIASCCDVRVASAGARFGAPIARLGFPMASREVALVMHAVGETAARAMLLAAKVFDAPYMRLCGFLTEVVAEHEHGEAVVQLAQGIAALAPAAARLNKQTLRALNRHIDPVDKAYIAPENIAENAAMIASDGVSKEYAYADSAEHREGIAAFLEKRSPQF